jgi:hypothetical protein
MSAARAAIQITRFGTHRTALAMDARRIQINRYAGYELAAQPQVMFTRQPAARGRWVWVPDHLPRLEMAHAFARVQLPLHLNWSAPGRVFDLGSRANRARVYEVVLQEGRPADILAYVDGALLVDLWDDLVLPRAVRSAWAPVIHASRGMAA